MGFVTLLLVGSQLDPQCCWKQKVINTLK